MGLFDRFKKKQRSGDSPAITERPLESDMLHNIRGCARDCATELNLDTEALSPAELVKAVNDHLHNWQKQSLPAPESPFKHEPLILGSLWAEQLVATLKWEWVMVVFHEHGDSEAVAVVSPNREMMICPFHFVFGCMANHAPVTIALSYNMLVEGSGIPPLPPNGYENVMDKVHHIVPPS